MSYSQNHNIDGWPICKDGEPLSKKECLAELQKMEDRIRQLESGIHNSSDPTVKKLNEHIQKAIEDRGEVQS